MKVPGTRKEPASSGPVHCGGQPLNTSDIPFVTLSRGIHQLGFSVHCPRAENYIAMETGLDLIEREIPKNSRSVGLACKPSWNIAMAIKVNADTRRICQALTVPEYLEAWICIPGQQAGSQVVACEHGNGYRLDHYAAGRVALSIYGSYRFRHQRKMRLFWRTTHRPDCTESLVDFRIRGNFSSSILELRQIALASAEDYLWHRKLWQNSLQTLASLLRFA